MTDSHAKPTYPWTRDWADTSTAARSGGWESFGGGRRVVSPAHLGAVNGLVLLGEAGLGKSHELVALAAHASAGGPPVPVYALQHTRGKRLRQIVRQMDAYRDWKRGDGHGFLLCLDALDEAPGEILAHVACLAAGGGDLATFRVWLTCRGPYWEGQRDLRERFAAIWSSNAYPEGAAWVEPPDEASGDLPDAQSEPPTAAPRRPTACTLYLCELSDAALLAAAREEDIPDPERFVSEVTERGAGPVARTPDTLAEVLRLFQERGEVPRSRLDVYRSLLPRLADEPERPARFTADERLATARRVAGVLTFCQLDAVATGRDRKGRARQSALAGGHEPLAAGNTHERVRITNLLVEETLGTALFAGLPEKAVEFVREPVREYLAADWLATREAPLRQIWSLLVASGQVRPHMRETAAWCASVRGDLFDALVVEDPEVLLRADLYAPEVTDARRQALVASMLQAQADGWAEWGSVPEGLSYPTIGEDLQAWIEDASADTWARVYAVRIARTVGAAGEACVAAALDAAAPRDLRLAALAAAPAVLGRGHAALDRLKPVARGNAGDDPHHDLQGLAAAALVPERLQASLALRAMPPPTEYRPHDPFLEALVERVIPALGLDAARSAETWATAVGDPLGGPEYHMLPDLLLGAVWLRLAALGRVRDVASSLVRAAVRQANLSGDVKRLALDRLRADTALRRQVLTALVARHDEPNIRAINHLTLSPRAIIQEADHAWLVEQYAAAQGDDRFWWATLVHSQLRSVEAFRTAFGGDPPAADPVRTLYARPYQDDEGALHRVDAFEPLDPNLAAQDARADAEHAALVRAGEAREAEEAAARAAHFARALDAGSWQLVSNELRASLNEGAAQQLRQWKVLADDQKSRVVHLATNYLASLEETSLATDDGLRDAKAALYTAYEDGGLVAIPARAWRPLATVLLRLGPSQERDRAAEDHAKILRQANREAPRAVLAAFEACVSSMVEEEPSPMGVGWRIYEYAEPVLSDETDAVITRALAARSVSSAALGRSLRVLLRRGAAGALGLAQDALAALDGPRPLTRHMVNCALSAAMALLAEGHGAAWPRLARAFATDPALFNDVVDKLASEIHDRGALRGLDPHGLVALYRHLDEAYPSRRPDRATGMRFHASFQDHLDHIRGRIALALADRGPGAEPAFADLADSVPHLRSALRKARRDWEDRAAPPPPLTELLSQVGQPRRRWVRTHSELFDVVVEEAWAFGLWLQSDQQPGVYVLWNAVPRSDAIRLVEGIARLNRKDPEPLVDELDALRKNKSEVKKQSAPNTLYIPKDEAALSDAFARFLRSRLGLAVVGRETEVRPGHSPDLVVSTFTLDEARNRQQVVELVVEVKPSWSDVVASAMAGQLAEGYLNPDRRPYGLYLVGWYGGDRWFDSDPERIGSTGTLDSKKSLAQAASLPDLRDVLELQARRLSRSGTQTLGVVVVDASLPPRSATGAKRPSSK